MKKHTPDLIIFAIIFLLLSDFSESEICHDMGLFRYAVPFAAAVISSVWFMVSHKGPLDHSWKGIFDVTVSVVGLGVVFLGMCLLDLWGFLRLNIFPIADAEGFSFLTTSWMIYFVSNLLVRITLITEKLFHWWERRNIKLKRIE